MSRANWAVACLREPPIACIPAPEGRVGAARAATALRTFRKRRQWDTGIVRPAHDAARLGRRQIVADARLRYCVQQPGMRASKWRPDFFLCTAKSPPQRWKVPACLRKPSLTRCRLPRWFLKAFRITPIQRKQQLMMSASLIGRLRSSALRPSTNSSVDVTHGLARATRGSLLATYG